MRNKWIIALAAAVILAGFGNMPVMTLAADAELGEVVDGSVLTEDEESEAEIDDDTRSYIADEEDPLGIMPCGTYLLTGTSSIKNAANGKITASGITDAKKTCKLKVKVCVQRYNKSSKTWDFVTSWTATKSSGTHLSTTKTMSVKKGYFYRVRSGHSAGGETGYSTTDGIWID